MNPLMRSHEREFILWGMADDPTWPGLKPSVASSCPAISRSVVAWLPGPDATCASAETTSKSERARVHLPDVVSVRANPRCSATRASSSSTAFVGRRQVQHVLLRAHRPLDAAQRVALRQILDPSQSDEQFLARVRQPLAHRRGLGRDVVAAPGDDECRLLAGQPRQPASTATIRSRTSSSDSAHLDLLHVLGQVARGHALVDVLVAGQRIELLDAGLDVVARDALALAIDARSTSSSTARSPR